MQTRLQKRKQAELVDVPTKTVSQPTVRKRRAVKTTAKTKVKTEGRSSTIVHPPAEFSPPSQDQELAPLSSAENIATQSNTEVEKVSRRRPQTVQSQVITRKFSKDQSLGQKTDVPERSNGEDTDGCPGILRLRVQEANTTTGLSYTVFTSSWYPCF